MSVVITSKGYVDFQALDKGFAITTCLGGSGAVSVCLTRLQTASLARKMTAEMNRFSRTKLRGRRVTAASIAGGGSRRR